jgi:hypothetical protein
MHFMKKWLYFIVALITTQFVVGQETLSSSTLYYCKSSGNLSEVTTWGTNKDGSGTNPANFNSDTFKLANRGSVYELTSDWSVRGALYLFDNYQIKLNGHSLSIRHFINNGMVTGSPTSNLILTGPPEHPLSFTTGAGNLNNLILDTLRTPPSSAKDVTIGSPLNIYGQLYVRGEAMIYTRNNITLKSTEARTALLERSI